MAFYHEKHTEYTRKIMEMDWTMEWEAEGKS